jgi:predicted HD phosphohydrolase
MTETATFTRMQDGTKDDWMKIATAHKADFANTADRFIEMLKGLENIQLGFGCDQLHHALMTATLARRAGASDEEIVVALCHDIAKVINVPNHGAIAAEMFKPYVSDDLYNILKYHQDFQGEHYYDYLGAPTDLRLQHKDAPWYDLAVKFVDEWDAEGFDPDFDVDSLDSFIPLIRKVVHDEPMALG